MHDKLNTVFARKPVCGQGGYTPPPLSLPTPKLTRFAGGGDGDVLDHTGICLFAWLAVLFFRGESTVLLTILAGTKNIQRWAMGLVSRSPARLGRKWPSDRCQHEEKLNKITCSRDIWGK